LIKRILVLFLVLQFHAVVGQIDLIEISDFGSNPGNLEMFLHVSKNHKSKNSLVVVLHGCTQDASSISVQSGWNKLSDKQGFSVLYPQQKKRNNPNDCFNWFQKKDIDKDHGEVFSIKQMIDYAIDSLKLNRDSIFVYGLSAGAAMGVALMADYPSTFQMGAILAGGPFYSATNPMKALGTLLSPSKKSGKDWSKFVFKQHQDSIKKFPKLIVIHGRGDQVVNIENSRQLILQWADLHQISPIPTDTIYDFNGHNDFVNFVYKDSAKNELISFLEVRYLGHELMVDPGEGAGQGGKTGLFSKDKDFFSTYWIASKFGLIKQED
jgi:poly(hydroxyalkanoate) depolymerase family esterase